MPHISIQVLLIFLLFSEPVPQTQRDMTHAVQRPHATDQMLQRQGSFRIFNKLQDTSPFKRQMSLRLNELPSTLERYNELSNPGMNGSSNGHGSGKFSTFHINNITYCRQIILYIWRGLTL